MKTPTILAVSFAGFVATPFLLISCGKGLHNYSQNGTASVLSGPSAVLAGASAFRRTGLLALDWIDQLLSLAIPKAYTGGGPPADGDWYVTPDKLDLTIYNVQLYGQSGNGNQTNIQENGGCMIHWDRTLSSLSSLASCPMAFSPDTYLTIGVDIKVQIGITIYDTTNNIYTDPSSPTQLSATPPSGGPTMITYTQPFTNGTFPGTFGMMGRLNPPITVKKGQKVPVYLLIDAIHTVRVQAASGVLQFHMDAFPAVFMPTVSAGRTAHYSSNATADNFLQASGQPLEISLMYRDSATLGMVVTDTAINMPSCAHTGDPNPVMIDVNAATAPIDNLGYRIAGFAGAHGGYAAFAESTDHAFTTYLAYFKMAEVSTLGGSTTLDCQLNATVPVPAPPDNVSYNSGVPAITSLSDSATLYLVGR